MKLIGIEGYILEVVIACLRVPGGSADLGDGACFRVPPCDFSDGHISIIVIVTARGPITIGVRLAALLTASFLDVLGGFPANDAIGNAVGNLKGFLEFLWYEIRTTALAQPEIECIQWSLGRVVYI